MDTVGALCALLEKKKELFLEYEKVTLNLLGSDADSAEQYIICRDGLANEIDEINEQIARICADQPAPELLRDAAGGRADFNRVPAEYHCVFYAGQAVRSVISRVVETEKQAVDHLELLRGQALENVKQNKDLPKIKKYLTDLSEQPRQGSLRNEKA